MRFADYPDRTYIINLPTRPDRRQAVIGELHRIGLDLQPGKVEIFDAIRPDGEGGFDSIGAHGCFKSHLSVLRAARYSGAKRILICEDDLLIRKSFSKYEDAIVAQLQSIHDDWDFIYMGHQEPVSADGPGKLLPVPSDKHLLLLHFYLINARVLDRLISFLETLLTRPPGDPAGGPMHVDGAYSVFRHRNPDVKTYLAEPVIGLQRGSRSDIAGGKWWDHIPLLRDAAGIARGLVTKIKHNQT